MNAIRMGLSIILLCTAANVALADEQKARLQWAQKVVLSTPISGVINTVRVKPGDKVNQGQVLMTLDSRALEARLKGAEAELAVAEQNLQEAQRELERTQEMYDRTMLAEHDLDVVKIALAAAESQLQLAQAHRTQAQWDLEYSAIKSPFDAWVIKVRAAVGQTVMNQLQAEPLLEVAKVGEMRVLGYVAADDFAKVRLEQPIMVKVAGDTFKGQVSHIALEADEEGQYAVEIIFNTRGRQLRAGLPAVVMMP